jgi:hypothetical protein
MSHRHHWRPSVHIKAIPGPTCERKYGVPSEDIHNQGTRVAPWLINGADMTYAVKCIVNKPSELKEDG